MIPEDDGLRRAEAALPQGLAAALAAARRQPPPDPSAELLARVLADAAAEQPAHPVAHPVSHPVTRTAARARPVWSLSAAMGAIGRIAGLGGLTSAALAAGLWIGIAQPGTTPDLFDLIGLGLAAETALLPDHDGLADFLDPEAGG